MNALNEYGELKATQVFSAGAVAGILAGSAMAIFLMLLAMIAGEGFWLPLKKISVTLLGESAIQNSVFELLPVIVGILIHFATAIAFGIVFAFIEERRQSYSSAVRAGIIYGLNVWIIMHFLVLPVINPVLAGMPYLLFAILHIIFGGTLGGYVTFLPTRAEVRAEISRRVA